MLDAGVFQHGFTKGHCVYERRTCTRTPIDRFAGFVLMITLAQELGRDNPGNDGSFERKKIGPQADSSQIRRGGEEEDRTPDLRIANATLSQLSYPPTTRRSLAKPAAPPIRAAYAAH